MDEKIEESCRQSLKDIQLFANMKMDEIEELLRHAGAFTHTYRRGEYVLLDKDRAHCICVVLSGIIHMVKENSSGHEALLMYLKTGQIFGETFVFRSEQISHVSFRAARSSQIMFVPFHEIQAVTEHVRLSHIVFARNVYEQICDKNYHLMMKLETISMESLREKILSYLRIEADRAGSDTFTLPLNRTEMAQFLCSNRSSLSRELAALKSEGIIDFHGNEFTLKFRRRMAET